MNQRMDRMVAPSEEEEEENANDQEDGGGEDNDDDNEKESATKEVGDFNSMVWGEPDIGTKQRSMIDDAIDSVEKEERGGAKVDDGGNNGANTGGTEMTDSTTDNNNNNNNNDALDLLDPTVFDNALGGQEIMIDNAIDSVEKEEREGAKVDNGSNDGADTDGTTDNNNDNDALDLLDPTVFDNALGGQGTTCIGASKSGLDGCLKLGEYAVKSSKAPIDQCIYCKKKNAVPLCLTCRISAKVRAKLKEGYKCQQGPTTNIQKFTSAGQCSSLGPATPSGPPPSSPPPPLPPPPLPPPPPPDAVGPSGEEEIESSVDEIKDVGLECPEAYVG